MRGLLLALGLACLSFELLAQEGHPMVGSWSGEWRPTPNNEMHVLVVLEWKERTITGVINPGYPDEAPVRGTLDSSKWFVRLEATSKDGRGNPVKVVIEGTLENVPSHNRALVGTMTRGGAKAAIKLTRE
jgi:hypothetical protein